MEINSNERFEANIKRMSMEIVKNTDLRSDEYNMAERLVRLVFNNEVVVEIREFKEIWKSIV